MCRAVLHMLVLLTLSCQPSPKSDMRVTASSLREEKLFQGSRFELVGLRLPFHSAQNWCEENGGRLASIPDEDAQLFLERHMDADKDMWIGLAPSCSTNAQPFFSDEGKKTGKQNLLWNHYEKVKHAKSILFLFRCDHNILVNVKYFTLTAH